MSKSGSGSKNKQASDTSAEQQLIRELADLLKDTDLTEIELERAGLRIRVARGGAPVTTSHAVAPAAPAAPSVEAPSAPPTASAAHNGNAPGTVTSPMVGTAYRSPEPDAPPFVDIGSMVSEGQTVMIVEAMKTMNQIPAPKAGTVKRILVEDGAPVEFGAPLMIIE